MSSCLLAALAAGCAFSEAPPHPDAGAADAFVPPRVECTTPGRTLSTSCGADWQCDDGCVCNGVEACEDGTCAAGEPACDDGVACTTDTCDEAGPSCHNEPVHEECDDGDLCNGVEQCVLHRGCVPGTAPACEDADPCTVDWCDPATGCVRAPLDHDGDGYPPPECGGSDCDDDPITGGVVGPDEIERCENGRDDDCNGLVDHEETHCVEAADACASDLPALPGPGSYPRSTVGLADDVELGCGDGGVDAVYRLELADERDVTLRVLGAGDGAALALRPLVGCESGPDRACDAAVGSGDVPELVLRNLPAGSWAVIVETVEPETFVLEVAAAPPSPLSAADRCDVAAPDVSAGGSFSGSFLDVADDYRLACASITGEPDAAYRLVVPADALWDVTLEASLAGTTTRNAFVALVRDCVRWFDDAATVACAGGSPARLDVRALEPGTYHVLVESSYGGAPGWRLDVTTGDSAGPLPADTCAAALDITDRAVSVPLATLHRDGDNRCDPPATAPGTRDAFFTFTLAGSRDVTLTTTAPAIHQVSVSTTSCGDPGPDTECHAGATVTRTWADLPAGTYHVSVTTNGAVGELTVGTALAP